MRGAEYAARERGYFLIVLDSQRSHDTEIDMMALLRPRVDGILLVTTGGYKWSAENAAAIASGPPVVCVDCLPEGLNTDSVCVDGRKTKQKNLTSSSLTHRLNSQLRRLI